MFSRTLAASLNELGERPWAELKKRKEIDVLWLAKSFRDYDIRPRTLWIADEHARGYLESDFEALYARYIPRSEVDALLAESARQAGVAGEKGGEQRQEAAEQPDSGGGTQRADDSDQGKGEPADADGGEAAAA